MSETNTIDAVKALLGKGQRAAFRASVKAVDPGEVIGSSIVLEPRKFSTGSYGWYGNGKITITVGGTVHRVQVGINATCVESKGWNQAQADAFTAAAKPFNLAAGMGLECAAKSFGSGSEGWFGGGKYTFQGYGVQLSCTLTVVKSKEWAD